MKLDYDVVIIGSGPAGVTSAIYLKRATLNVVIIEKDVPGGQIVKTSMIENYPGIEKIEGPNLAMKFYEQVTNLKVPYKFGEVTEIIDKDTYKIVKIGEEEITCKAIILAVGKKPKTLGNTDLVGKGISYCSLCDGALYKGEAVAIVGGGNSALEEALYLSDICKKVTIIHRRDEMRGDEMLVERIKKRKNIDVLYNSVIETFNEVNNRLDSISVKVEDKLKKIKVKACFIFIGYEPATGFLKDLGILDKMGNIEVNERYETKVKRIYAAGDVVKKDAYQIVTATADGALAAVSCTKDLS